MVIGMLAFTGLFVILTLNISSIIKLAVGFLGIASGATVILKKF